MRNVVEISLGKLKRGRNKWKQRQKKEEKVLQTVKKGMHRALEHGHPRVTPASDGLSLRKNYRFLERSATPFRSRGDCTTCFGGILVIPKRCATESP
ncbi:MAG: hypothetical protein ACLR23_19340 [Clostridia bacterium]